MDFKLQAPYAPTGDQPEAIEALVALGYDATSAAKAVKSVENASELDAGALLKKALKHLF